MKKSGRGRLQAILCILCVIAVILCVHINVAALSVYGKLQNVKYFNEKGQEGVLIYFDNIQEYSDFTLSNPDRVIIDFENSLYDGPSKTINTSANSSIIKTVRYAQFKENIVRAVLDLNGKYDKCKHEYKIEQGEGYIKLYINTDINNNSNNNSNSTDSSSEKGNSEDNPSIKRENNRTDGQSSRGSDSRGVISLPNNISVCYAPRGELDEVSISLGNHKDYKISALTQPERIIVDIPDAKFSDVQQEVGIDGNLVKSMRYAQYQDKLGRIVLDLTEESMFRVNETEGKLILSVEKPVYKNITYKNMTYSSKNDRVFFSINGAKLTELKSGEELKKFYTGRYDSTGRIYTVTFLSRYANIPSGVIKIDDHLFESVTIANNLVTKKTSIIFKAKDKFIYEIITRPMVNDTAINILKPASNAEKLVIIDAGHGGVEPGALYGNLKEKDLNLDIAIRLNKLLKEKNVNTYMIREDDSYVWYYERAFIANSLNAKLFLSIHNNAIGDPGFDGTMTLYNVNRSEGKNFNSYDFAKNVQTSLLKTLGSKDRKLRERPDLVVLKYTKMPAALAEIAFLTNAVDRSKLQNPEYRQKVAQALCDAVIKSLSQVR